MASPQSAAGDSENEAAAFGAGEPLALPDPDWLLNRLTISGPAGVLARFRAAAQGTNVAPWHLDLDEEEAVRADGDRRGRGPDLGQGITGDHRHPA